MAKLVSGTLGNIVGKLGNNTFYFRDGVQVIAKPPKKYKSKSSRVKAQREKFAALNQFAKSVFRSDIIKNIWWTVEPRKTAAYNKLISLNSAHFIDNHPTTRNIITPKGNYYKPSEISYNKGKIKIRFYEGTSGTLVLFLVLYNTEGKKLPKFQVIDPFEEPIPGNDLEISLNDKHISLINSYKNYLIFAAVISDEGWSETFAAEGLT